MNEHMQIPEAPVPTTPFCPQAVYFADSDCVEYVNEDSLCIHDRVDSFLTLIFDGTRMLVIGFKLDGFKYKFETHMQSLFELNDRQFIELASLLEFVFTEVGKNIFAAGDERRKNAYKAAIKLAKTENIKLAGAYLAKA